MDLTNLKSRTIIPLTGQYEDLPLTFVAELLAKTLTDEGEEILVEGSSQNFLYNTESGIQIGESLKMNVLDVKTKQLASTIEINLSGTIETATGLQQSCNLYFFMWLDHTQTSPLKKYGAQQLKPVSLLIHSSKVSECIFDSVFELDLYRRKTFRQQEHLGQGRGYLVFGRNQ